MSYPNSDSSAAKPLQPQALPFSSKPLLFGMLSCIGLSAVAPVAMADQRIIEEVIVTAQKREQSMQDVSIAVSAFSGDAIEKMGFEEGLDITAQVPNMNYFAIFGEASSPSVSLRGISLVNFSDSWESPVSIYVDDVYRGNPAGSAIALFDLERVEVLRGPQGTLYGRNTTGGLVHYVSRKPTDTLEARASLSYGSYQETIVEGAISGPLSDKVNARIATKHTHNDGWQTAYTPKPEGSADDAPYPQAREKLNNSNTFGFRALFDVDTSENSQLLLNVHGSNANQQSVGFAHMGYLSAPIEGAARCDIAAIHAGQCTSATFGETGSDFTNGNYGPEAVAMSTPGGLMTQIDTFGTSATFTYDWEAMSLTSITAYEELEKFLQDDGDGTPVVFFDEQYSVDAEQLTQELRLDGLAGETAWVAGLYYYKDKRDLLTQAPTTSDGLWHQEIVDLKSESWAIFGQLEQPLMSTLTLIAGIRYTDETRDFSQDSGPSFYDEIDVTRDLAESATTGRLGIDWRPYDGMLGYVSYSTGFKSGGFSGSYNASLEATQPVEAETVDNIELGFKTRFAGGYQLNGALFSYTVEDYQAQVFLSVEDGSVITNAGEVTGTGAELELTAPITDNFEVIAGLGYLDTEFDSEQIFIVAGDEFSLDGNELPSAPGLSYNLMARYYLGLSDYGDVVLQADYAWQDDHFLQIENDPYSKHDGYGIGNAKISWHPRDTQLTLEAFVNNIADEEYFTYQNTLGSDWGYGVWGQPRTGGVRIAWELY
ncbi:MAG TPA: TonB-dependent receptor [Marinagarivorans sp.]